MSAIKILRLPGSLRTGSLNARLAAAAAYQFAQAGAEVTRISLGDFPLPIYDGDLQTKSGVPKNAINLKRMIGAHHGVVIVTPEYNSSVPPLVKNTIDWVTRVQDAHETRGQVFRERAFAIAAASAGRLGRTRSLAALRLVLSACHASVIPNQLALSFADQAYDDMDRLKHPADVEALNALVKQLIDASQRVMGGNMQPSDIAPRDRLIVPLDLPGVAAAEAMIARLGDSVTFYKIGYQLAFAGGLPLVRQLADAGKKVFVDLKLHDIGNTVARGGESVDQLCATFLTVHAYPQNMRAAVEARAGSDLKILAVTVLTSYDDGDLHAAGYRLGVSDLVEARAQQAQVLGVDGLVCSPEEAASLHKIVGHHMVLVTPGIRPSGAASGDQKRIMTRS